MRYLVFLIFALLPYISVAQEWEDYQRFGPTDATDRLTVISSTDTGIFAPILEGFLAQNSDTLIEYYVTSTTDLDAVFRATPEQFDVAISSAMDLQLKLANDGYAQKLERLEHPGWAKWRNSLFAFTTEPAAIVINKSAFDPQAIPQTRQDLIEALRADPDKFRNRVGTYDVRISGLGYLFATQDARASETYWRLMEVMGALNVRLYCCSGDMIDDLADGTLAVAYNVLGSYSAARTETHDVLESILPADFPTTMMRTAFVSSQAQSPDLAASFVEHLISKQTREASNNRLPPLTEDQSAQASIALGPALMTYLDAQKRRLFLRAWESAVIQGN